MLRHLKNFKAIILHIMDCMTVIKVTALYVTLFLASAATFLALAPYVFINKDLVFNIQNLMRGVAVIFFTWATFKLICFGRKWISSNDPGEDLLKKKKGIARQELPDTLPNIDNTNLWKKTGARPKTHTSYKPPANNITQMDWSVIKLPRLVSLATRIRRRTNDTFWAIESICAAYSEYLRSKMPLKNFQLAATKSYPSLRVTKAAAKCFVAHECTLKGPVDWPSLPPFPSYSLSRQPTSRFLLKSNGVLQEVVRRLVGQFSKVLLPRALFPARLLLQQGATVQVNNNSFNSNSLLYLKTPVPPTEDLNVPPTTKTSKITNMPPQETQELPRASHILYDKLAATGASLQKFDLDKAINDAEDLRPVEEVANEARRQKCLARRKERWLDFRGRGIKKLTNINMHDVAFSVGLVGVLGLAGYGLYRLMKH